MKCEVIIFDRSSRPLAFFISLSSVVRRRGISPLALEPPLSLCVHPPLISKAFFGRHSVAIVVEGERTCRRTRPLCTNGRRLGALFLPVLDRPVNGVQISSSHRSITKGLVVCGRMGPSSCLSLFIDGRLPTRRHCPCCCRWYIGSRPTSMCPKGIKPLSASSMLRHLHAAEGE